MIVSNTNRSGSIKSAINYFLSEKNSKKELRPHPPEIIKGDKALSIEVGKLTEHNTRQTVSGTIAFAEGEQLTKSQMLEVIEQFEKTFFGNMKDRVNAIYVLHQEKDRFHIHYAIPRIDLQTGKSYNPFPPGDETAKLMKDFSAKINHEYGFNQVEEKPFKPQKSKTQHLISKGQFSDEVKTLLKSKSNFDKACQDLVKQGIVKNRKELIGFLKSNGYELSRINKDFISIKNHDGQNIRLRGGIYSSDANYSEIKEKAAKPSQPKPLTPFDAQKLNSRIEWAISKRDEYNKGRYMREDRPTELQAHREDSSKQAPATLAKSGDIQPPTTMATTHQAEPLHTDQAQPQAVSSTPGTDDTPTHDTAPTTTGGTDLTTGLEGAIQQTAGKLANAKTFKERVMLEARLASLMAEHEAKGREKLQQKGQAWKI